MDMPFKIGNLLWEARGTPQHRKVPCPVCFEQCRIKVTLGDGEEVWVHCDACTVGIRDPQGVIDETTIEPRVRQFTIAEVVSYHANDDGHEWRLKSCDGYEAYFDDLFPTHTQAKAKAVADAELHREHSMRMLQGKKEKVAHAGWTVHYHRKQAKDLERQVAWHRGKIEEKKIEKSLSAQAGPHTTEG